MANLNIGSNFFIGTITLKDSKTGLLVIFNIYEQGV